MVWECALDPIEILTEECRRVGVGITTRVAEEPELIMLSYPRSIAEGVDHRGPARCCFLQAVHKNHRCPGGIVLLQQKQPRRVRIFLRVHHARKSEPFRTFARNQHCGGRIEVDG